MRLDAQPGGAERGKQLAQERALRADEGPCGERRGVGNRCRAGTEVGGRRRKRF